jgi:hypothetical protein
MNRPAVVAAKTVPTFCAYRKKEFVGYHNCLSRETGRQLAESGLKREREREWGERERERVVCVCVLAELINKE